MRRYSVGRVCGGFLLVVAGAFPAAAEGFLEGVVGLLGGDRQRLLDRVLEQAAQIELSPGQMQVLNGVVSAGVFEFQDEVKDGLSAETLARLAQVALQANAALARGASPDAVEEIAQAALGQKLEGDMFQAAVDAQAALLEAGVAPEVSRSWLGHALAEGWPATMLRVAGAGIAEVVRQGGDAEQMALALSVAVAQAPEGSDPAALVAAESAFVLGPLDSDEKRRRVGLFSAQQQGIAAGVPRSVAYGLYEHALLEGWPAPPTRRILEGIGRGVGEGLPAEQLALALVVRVEQEGTGLDVERAIDEEIAYVRQQLGLPEVEPSEAAAVEADSSNAAPVADTGTEADPVEKPAAKPSAPVIQPIEKPVSEPLPKPSVAAKPKPQKSKPTKVAPGPMASSKRVSWQTLQRSISSFMGTPYVWGGETRRGTDCSGFTQTVYGEQGVRIPRISRDQYGFLKKSKALVEGRRQRLSRGALVFFNKNGRGRITHVGVYMGDGKFAHASSSRGVVLSDFDKPYYRRLFVDGGHVCTVVN